MAYYPKSGSGGGYGRIQVLPGGPNDYGGALRTIEGYDSQQAGNQALTAQQAQQAAEKQLAEENGLKASGIGRDKEGNPYLEYKSTKDDNTPDVAGAQAMADEFGLKPTSIKLDSKGRAIPEYGKEDESGGKTINSQNTAAERLLNPIPAGNASDETGELLENPIGTQTNGDMMQASNAIQNGGFNPAQIQQAIAQLKPIPPVGSTPTTGDMQAAQTQLSAPPAPPPINTSLPAMQNMLQQQAMVGNPMTQRIAALNKNAQDQQAAQEQQQGGPTPSATGQMPLTPDIASQILAQAGGDKAKARAIAKSKGFSF